MLAEFSITPLDKGESVSKYVARSLKLVAESGLNYKISAMGTLVEGEPDEVFELIKQCHMHMCEISDRVSTLIKIDDRKGKTNRLNAKIESVEKHLGKTLNK
jgi:uncharacterized protein (TIGR00106 family)